MMNDKIHTSHLSRAALVYVRQSTMQQVHNNHESRRRQYDLQARARDFGFREIVVIDEDLGRSGSGLEVRPGFARLVAAVCESKVGAVLALEASRLARNNHDWHHLLELCRMTQTLVIDHDGVYDPRLLNDRLLLGLKGTMSEFELSLFRQRAHEALLAKARRGEVVMKVPVGYVKALDGRIELTPDLQIQNAIQCVFAKFAELGSVRQVLMWYRQEDTTLPRQDQAGEIHWRIPSYTGIKAILTNPIYAGAYAYGRTTARTRFVDGRARKTRGHCVSRDDWKVLIPDHHEGYISWDEYMSIEKRITSNAVTRGLTETGAAKCGHALLAGLLRCRRCGRKLHVAYGGNRGQVARYHCREGNLNNGTSSCISLGAMRLDKAIEKDLFEALAPEALKASFLALEQTSGAHDQKQRSVTFALEKARYEAQRARRQYDAVDPENRLVAAQLENRWNQHLQTVAELEAQLAALSEKQSMMTEEQRQEILALGQDVEKLWHHPHASHALKKRIVRCLIEEIIVDLIANTDGATVSAVVHWKGGIHTQIQVRKNATGHHGRRTDHKVVEIVRELAKVFQDNRIACNLNRLGYRTGTGLGFDPSRVRSLRNQYSIPAFNVQERSWVTLEEAARTLSVSTTFVRSLLRRNILEGQQIVPQAPWTIRAQALEQPQVLHAVRNRGKGRHFSPEQDELL